MVGQAGWSGRSAWSGILTTRKKNQLCSTGAGTKFSGKVLTADFDLMLERHPGELKARDPKRKKMILEYQIAPGHGVTDSGVCGRPQPRRAGLFPASSVIRMP